MSVFFAGKRLSRVVLCALGFFCVSCGGKAGGPEVPVTEAPPRDSAEIRTVPAMSVEDAIRLPEGSQGRRMILEKGNVWTTGLPGFGENALPALSGTYSIAAPGGTADMALFTVWLCRETLYYDDWDMRAGVWSEDFRVLEKQGRDSLLVAAPFNESWTGIFSFPSDSDLSRNDIDRIIGIYRSRFLYFLTLARSSSDISLPAQADF
ncbi:MAG: hypothetical protein LBP69_04185 [Treponema sp.]|jgi:hypothetical protein|nr:hypothetical protein [Treponema sp.]